MHNILLQGIAQPESSRKDRVGMTQLDHERLFSALRGPVETDDPVSEALRDSIAGDDLRNVLPVVREIERNAEERGRFGILLEICWNNSQAERRT